MIFKLLDMNQFIVTSCPIAIMLVYAWCHRKHQSQLDIVGDNLYYLGFLYTLVSLAMSLFEFSSNDEAVETIAPIITNFGIAIFSTIFGIAFRVFFNLMHNPEETVSDFSDTVRDLNKGVSDLDIELRKFSTFRIGLEQILGESLNRQKKAIAQFKASVTRFNKTVEAGREQFQGNLDNLGQTVSGLNAQVSNLDSTVNESSDAVATSVNKLVEKINEMNVPEDLIEQLLQPYIQNIETGAEQISNSVSVIMTRFNETVEAGREQLQGNLDSLGQTVSGFNAQVSNLDSTVNESSDTVAASVSKLVEKINGMNVPEDLIEQLLQPPIQGLQTGTEQIGDAIEALTNRLNNVQIPTDELEQGLQQVANAVSASANDLIDKCNNAQVNMQEIEALFKQPETSIKRTAEEQRPADGNP